MRAITAKTIKDVREIPNLAVKETLKMSDDPEYVVVETKDGEGIVCVVPCEDATPRDIDFWASPLPLEEAYERAAELNEGASPEEHGNDAS